MGNGKLIVCFHTRAAESFGKWEMGICSLVQAVMDPVGNGKWEIAWGHVEQAPWEMGNGKLLSWKMDVLEPPAFGKREMGN